MTVTCTIITLSDDAANEREVAIRGDAYDMSKTLTHLDRFMKARGLYIVGMVGYQQPSFYQSLYYHETGEVI